MEPESIQGKFGMRQEYKAGMPVYRCTHALYWELGIGNGRKLKTLCQAQPHEEHVKLTRDPSNPSSEATLKLWEATT